MGRYQMYRFVLFFFLIGSIFFPVTSFSQPFIREIDSIPVIVHGDTLSQPFAGGIDGPNHRFVDIDGDGDYDLFIFDADQNVDFYRNEGTPQTPIFKLRPNEITLPQFTAWFVFVDLNGDNKIDLLTDNGGNSVNYYVNQGTREEPNFVLQASPMRDTSGNPIVNGFIGIPALTDIDGDGDYDFFASNFDGSVTMYENIGTPTSPSFRYADGRFQDVAIINDSCKKGLLASNLPLNTLHGGSILQFADLNHNGTQDLFMGDLNSRSMFYLPNEGTATIPSIQCTNMHFPPDGSLLTSGYNQPNLIDIDGDGDLDLFIGAFIDMGPTNMQSHTFWYYQNIGDSVTPFFRLMTKDYISMIDVGRNSHPAFIDINHDGKLDMVVGNLNGQLWYFENTGTRSQPAFTLKDTLFAGIAGSYSYAPVFVDIDGDRYKDLVLGRFDGKVMFYRYNDTASTPHYESQAFDSLSVGAGKLPVPAFTDMDGDGDYDLLVGTSDGHIRYYRNDGDSTHFVPTLVTPQFDNINVGTDANPVFVDIDGDGDDDLFVGNASGNIYFFENTGGGQFVQQTDSYGNIQPLKESAPAFADIDNDGDLDLFVGTFKGGMHFYRNEAPAAVKNPTPGSQLPNQFVLEQNYPNPFNPSTNFGFKIAEFGMVTLNIYNILGENVATVINKKLSPGAYTVNWNASGLPSGIYTYRLSEGTHSQTKKMLIIK